MAAKKRGRVVARCWVVRADRLSGTWWLRRDCRWSLWATDALEFADLSAARDAVGARGGKVYRRGKRVAG